MKNVEKLELRFGRLTPKYATVRNDKWYFLCLCDCGHWTEVSQMNLARSTNSCGCLKKEKLGAERRLNAKSCLNNVLRYYKRNAKTRNISWNIADVDFKALIVRPCSYCGVDSSNTTRTSYGFEFKFNGVDRIDNSLPYSKDNCVTACRTCNTAKMNNSREEFLNWVKAVYEQNFLH